MAVGHDERIRRVSKSSPCPVCGPERGIDWCGFTSYMVRCMREPSVLVNGRVVYGKPHRDGGWVYSAKDLSGWIAPANTEPDAATVVKVAPVEVRDRWYRPLLDLLPLNPTHQANLLGRGISPEMIAQRQYRSMPLNGRIELCHKLINRVGGEPVGVPGFYQHPKTGSWLLAGAVGMLVPVLDREGRIQGFQVRRDLPPGHEIRETPVAAKDGARATAVTPDGEVVDLVATGPTAERLLRAHVGDQLYGEFLPLPGGIVKVQRIEKPARYPWLSSAGKGPNGSSSGTPLHIARPVGLHKVDSRTAWITEGPLKADRLCEWKRCLVIATPGVNARAGLVEELKALGVQNVVVAYDMDREDNPGVRLALEQLIQELLAAGFWVHVASWDIRFKGIDDAIQGKRTIRLRVASVTTTAVLPA